MLRAKGKSLRILFCRGAYPVEFSPAIAEQQDFYPNLWSFLARPHPIEFQEEYMLLLLSLRAQIGSRWRNCFLKGGQRQTKILQVEVPVLSRRKLLLEVPLHSAVSRLIDREGELTRCVFSPPPYEGGGRGVVSLPTGGRWEGTRNPAGIWFVTVTPHSGEVERNETDA